MLLSTGLLVVVFVHLKTSAEAYDFPPSFQPPRFQQFRFSPTVVPQRFQVAYLLSRLNSPPGTVGNEFISSKSDISNNIIKEKYDFKLKPSTLLLVEDLEEEPDYGAIFRENNEREFEKKVPKNEKPLEEYSVNNRGEEAGYSSHGSGRGYRPDGARNHFSGFASSGDWEVGGS